MHVVKNFRPNVLTGEVRVPVTLQSSDKPPRELRSVDYTPGPELFGRWLDLTMTNRDIKGRAVAKRLNVHDSAVSRWRTGQGVPTMDTTLKLGKLLDVDPMRLAVTAGLVDGDLIGVKPLPMPEPTAQRNAVKAQLMKVRGLTASERQKLLDVYDSMGAELT